MSQRLIDSRGVYARAGITVGGESSLSSVEVGTRVQLIRCFGVFGGWRWWKWMEENAEDTSDVKLDLSGPLIGLQLTF